MPHLKGNNPASARRNPRRAKIAQQRKFNGKVFTLTDSFSNKREAEGKAKRFRGTSKTGRTFQARVVESGGQFRLYVR